MGNACSCGKGKKEGCANGPTAEARFCVPTGLALDMDEDLIVADADNNNVRKVALPDGRVTTVPGSVEGGDAGRGGGSAGEGGGACRGTSTNTLSGACISQGP